LRPGATREGDEERDEKDGIGWDGAPKAEGEELRFTKLIGPQERRRGKGERREGERAE